MLKKTIFIITALCEQYHQAISADTFEAKLNRAKQNGKIVILPSDKKECTTIALSPTAGSSYNPHRQIPAEIAKVAGGMLIGFGLMTPHPQEQPFIIAAGIISIAACLYIQSKEHARESEKNVEAINVFNEQCRKLQECNGNVNKGV